MTTPRQADRTRTVTLLWSDPAVMQTAWTAFGTIHGGGIEALRHAILEGLAKAWAVQDAAAATNEQTEEPAP